MKEKDSKSNVSTPDVTFDNATFPSIKARMGSIEYFVTTMTFSDVAKWIKQPSKTSETSTDFKTWLQREIDPARLRKIAQYLSERDQRFFSSIVVGIFDGEPNWFPVIVTESPVLGDVIISERTKTSMGVLQLSGSEQSFSIDGQHRVEAIKAALRDSPELATDELSVIFLSHKVSNAGRERTRRLFTNLNKYARPVSQGEIVALDEDDAFAIVTRGMTDEFRPLRGLISYTKTANLRPSDHVGVTSTVGLYQLIQLLPRAKGSKSLRKLKDGPAEKHEEEIKQIRENAENFWNVLGRSVPEMSKVLGSPPSKNLAGDARKSGGNLLFRPAGQQIFVKAVASMVASGKSMEDSITTLSKVELNLTKAPWKGTMWNAVKRTMILKDPLLKQNLLLYMANQKLSREDYDLQGAYQRAMDDDTAELPAIS